MIPCYNAKLCGNARRVTRVTRVTEQAHIFELISLSLSLRIYTLFCPDSVYT